MAWFQIPFLPEFVMYSLPERWSGQLSSSDYEVGCATAANPATCRGMISYYRQALRDAVMGHAMKPIPITRPVLQIWGRNDDALGVGLAVDLPRRWTTHPNSRVKLLEATHWVIHDQPQAVNKAILEFVQEQ